MAPSAAGAKVHQFPVTGSARMYVMIDFELTNPINAIGENFQIAYKPFRPEKLGTGKRLQNSKVEDVDGGMFTEWVQPSLELKRKSSSTKPERCVACMHPRAAPVRLHMQTFIVEGLGR